MGNGKPKARIQAIDRFMPSILGRRAGPANEPRIGLLFSFLLAEVAILLGGLVVRNDRDRGFGVGRKIDIWWGGLDRNGALMLLLGYLLSSHDDWRHAEVRILTAVRSDLQRKKATSELQRLLERTHLEAKIHVVLMGGSSISKLMDEESSESDLVLVGLRQPRADESAAEFFGHYEEILASLKTTMLVASSPSFEGAAVLFDPSDLKVGGGDGDGSAAERSAIIRVRRWSDSVRLQGVTAAIGPDLALDRE